MVYRRRRYNKRKRRRGGNSKYKQYLYNQKKRNGVRTFKHEYISQGFESGHGVCRFEIFNQTVIGDRAHFCESLDSTLGTSGTQLSGLGANFSSATVQYRWHYPINKATTSWRSMSAHPIYLTLYECSPKRDMNVETTSFTSTPTMAMKDLVGGWKLSRGGGTASATAPTGDAMISYSDGDQACTVQQRFIQPHSSKHFMSKYKIIRQKTFKLQPGDEAVWKSANKPYTFSASYWNGTGYGSAPNEDSAIYMKSGVTKFLLAKIHGAVGVATTDDTHKLVGLMNVSVALSSFHKSSLIRVDESKNEHAIKATLDDLTAVTLGAPADYVDEVEDDL